MAHFLNNRSCNDDYIPIDKLMIIPPDMLENNKHLNHIDAQLEALYSNSQPNINEELEEPRQPFDEHEQEIFEFADANYLSIAEAVDYLKTCHHCGNPDIPFADLYCNERCQDYSIEYCYPCYRQKDCKICDNWDRHFDHSNTNKEDDEDNNKDIIDNDVHIIDNDDHIIDNDDPDCYPTMDQYYDSIHNNNDDEPLPTTTSHCSLCDSYVYKIGKHCKSCIAYHGKHEFTNYTSYYYYDNNDDHNDGTYKPTQYDHDDDDEEKYDL